MSRLRAYGRFCHVAWVASPLLTLVTAGSVLLGTVAQLASAATIGALVSRVPAIARDGIDSGAARSAFVLLGVAVIFFVLQWTAAGAQALSATSLGERVDSDLQRRLITAVMKPAEIGHLENPRTADLINVGRETFRSWRRPGQFAGAIASLSAARLTAVGAGALLIGFRWPAAIVAVSAAVWASAEGTRSARLEAQHHYGDTELSRRADYFYELGVNPAPAKEIRVFGLAEFIRDRFLETWHASMASVFGPGGSRRGLLASLILGASALGTLAWIGADAFGGRIAAGPATVYAQALVILLGSVGMASSASLQCELAMATLDRYDEAMRVVRAGTADGTDQETALRMEYPTPTTEIRFEDVSFRYTDGSKDVLDNLELRIPIGQSLAIVGANGVGKTTLVKLLCRLYQPQGGRITVDGREIRDGDAQAWRKHIAAVFQDFVRYDLTARENIGLGAIGHDNDLTGIATAAADAGIADRIEAFNRGWDTILSPNYTGGVDLSGGEWQKIALARALFALRHGASILILDEPAANLDARAESELYERFIALTRGVTTIVISHRFSTVRQASSIVVLRDGRVSEQGTHEELLALGGHYAGMFRLQAARFEGPATHAEAETTAP